MNNAEASEYELLYSFTTAVSEEEPSDQIDLSCFSGNLLRNDLDDGRNCWKISDGNNFKVRSKNFVSDKSKVSSAFSDESCGPILVKLIKYMFYILWCYVYDSNVVLQIPAGKPLMELVAVDWLKDSKRMDHVARRHGCAVRVRFCCLFHVRLHGVPFSCLSLSSFLKH